jgi:hypothetical protein
MAQGAPRTMHASYVPLEAGLPRITPAQATSDNTTIRFIGIPPS